MGKLHDMLNPAPAIPIRHAYDYKWERVYEYADEIRKIDAASPRLRIVEVDVEVAPQGMDWLEWHEAKGRLFDSVLGYGDSMVASEEAYEYENGHILLCAVVSAWGGTFHSNSNEVRFFHLIPNDTVMKEAEALRVKKEAAKVKRDAKKAAKLTTKKGK